MPKENKVKATARAVVHLEIELKDQWGHDCGVDQIHKQGREKAKDIVVSMIASARRNADILSAGRILILGEPEVTAVLVEEDRS